MKTQYQDYPDEMETYFRQDPVLCGTDKALEMHYDKIDRIILGAEKEIDRQVESIIGDNPIPNFRADDGVTPQRQQNNPSQSNQRRNTSSPSQFAGKTTVLPRRVAPPEHHQPRVQYREMVYIKNANNQIYHHSFEIDTNDHELARNTMQEVNETKTAYNNDLPYSHKREPTHTSKKRDILVMASLLLFTISLVVGIEVFF